VQAGQGEGCVVVVERRVRPDNRVMTQLALLREARRYVVRIRGALVIREVASHAQCAVQIVVAVHVTIGASARRHGVRSRQWEARAVVVKGRTQPSCRGVTGVAGLREVRRHVVGVGRALVIL